MTLISTNTQKIGREAGFPETDLRLEGARVVKTLTDRWVVHSDDPNETGLAIYNQLPIYMQVGFDYGDGFTIRSVKLKRNTDNRLMWVIDIRGDDQVTDQEKEDQEKPPDQRRTEWSWDFETQEIALTVDVDGERLVNAVEDPFEVTTPVAIPVLTVTRQQRSFDPDTIINYVNHVNDARFWGAPKGAAFMAGIRDQKGETYNGVEYRAVTYIIKFAVPDIPDVREGWKLLILNNGPNKIDQDTGEKVAAKDATGSKITVNLDESGLPLDDGADPVILRFKPFEEADFGALGINWPLR